MRGEGGGRSTTLSTFVGRGREAGQVRALLAMARLVTLTGTGGSGKTRLAMRVAQQLRPLFVDGVWLVDLASLADESLLECHIAAVLGIDSGGERTARQVVRDYLSDRELLLVLDNCEHLLDACAAFIGQTLRAAAGVRILCTSRQPLGIIGEHIFTVPPLSVPSGRTAFTTSVHLWYPALALFVDRARVIEPGFALTAGTYPAIAEICRRLDGLPLAIELAASALRTQPVDQLAVGLPTQLHLLSGTGLLARHRTLEATLDWSFTLCSLAERTLWSRVSVFAGGFDLAAAEYVCGDEHLSAGEVVEALVGLVDKSVICMSCNGDEVRYRLLEPVRLYGLDRLRATGHPDGRGERALRHRHLEYYLHLAERFHANWFGPDQQGWARRMHTELPNLRVALGRCLVGGQSARLGLTLAGALYYFWYGCGAVCEGRHWIRRALDDDPEPSPERARALAAYAWLLLVRSAPAAAADQARECLDLAGRFDQLSYVIDALQVLGLSLLYQDDSAAGLPLLEEAVTRARDLGPTHPAVAMAQQHLAVSFLFRGDPVRAGTLLADAQQICRSYGEQWWLGRSLLVAVAVALALGDPTCASDCARRGLLAASALRDRLSTGAALEFMAWIAAADRDYRRAARLLGAAGRQWRAIGGSPIEAHPWKQGHEICDTTTRQTLGDDAFTTELRWGADFTLAQAVTYALQH
jgi:non-specific serine/threonine protein kinase